MTIYLLSVLAVLSSGRATRSPSGDAIRGAGLTEEVVLVAGLSEAEVSLVLAGGSSESLMASLASAESTLASASSEYAAAVAGLQNAEDPTAAEQRVQQAESSLASANAGFASARESLLAASLAQLSSSQAASVRAAIANTVHAVPPQFWAINADDAGWQEIERALAWHATQSEAVSQRAAAATERIAESLGVASLESETTSLEAAWQNVSTNSAVAAAAQRLADRLASTRAQFSAGPNP